MLLAAAGHDVMLVGTGHGIDDIIRGNDDERTALADYHTTRDCQLREIFEITCELVTYPPVERFIELQKQLGVAIDTQAAALAARPLPRLIAA